MITFENKNGQDILIYNNQEINIKENFQKASKLIISHECNKETLAHLEDRSLVEFFSRFLTFKEGLSEEKLLEELEQRVGYDFSYRDTK